MIQVAPLSALLAFALVGCATPVVMLKNSATGQVARCGGGVTGSIAGGLIGHNLEKSSDESCVRDFEVQGFRRADSVGTAPSPAQPLPQSTLALPATATRSLGQNAYQVERMPESKACNPQAAATLSGKAAGVETYTVACSNGDVLIFRCEFTNCRALK